MKQFVISVTLFFLAGISTFGQKMYVCEGEEKAFNFPDANTANKEVYWSFNHVESPGDLEYVFSNSNKNITITNNGTEGYIQVDWYHNDFGWTIEKIFLYKKK